MLQLSRHSDNVHSLHTLTHDIKHATKFLMVCNTKPNNNFAFVRINAVNSTSNVEILIYTTFFLSATGVSSAHVTGNF